jgi:hypothetical protein
VPQSKLIWGEYCGTVPQSRLIWGEYCGTVPQSRIIWGEYCGTVPQLRVIWGEYCGTVPQSRIIWGEYCGTVPQSRIIGYLNPKCFHRNYSLVKTHFAVLLHVAQNIRNGLGARVIAVPTILYSSSVILTVTHFL